MIVVNYIRKTLYRRCLTGFWIFWGSEDTMVLNMLLVLNMLRVQNTPEIHRVLNMPEYGRIIPEYAWFCLNKCEYAWIYRNKYDVSKSAVSIWFAFCFRLNVFTIRIWKLILPLPRRNTAQKWHRLPLLGVNSLTPKFNFF